MVIKTESVIIQKKSEMEKKVKRPNILFLMSDEHRFDVAGFSGNTIVKTPHLDSLAKSGVVFNNAYTPSPVCIPARQCMMSGQYPKTCGCEVFGEDLAPGYMTFARRFSEYAYATVACGKLHHCGTDQMQGWTQRIGMGDIHVSDRFIDNKDEKSFEDYSVPVSSVKWTQVKEVKRAGVGKGSIRETDDYTVEGAVRFIDKYFNDLWYDREQKKRPLLLKVSLVKPHYPYLADEDKFRYYLNRVKPYFENVTFDHPALTPHKAEVGKDVSEREIRRAAAAYYAMVEELDEQFGKIIGALENAGENIDDWIVVYTSDHGEMLGQHGVWEKQKFYEGSARVPLFIRFPSEFKPGTVNENVNLCDLFATLCDIAGIPLPEGTESKSLVPLMKGEKVNFVNETISQFGRTHLMIKKDSLKYMFYGDKLPDMLFDLDANPEETVDFISAPAYSEIVGYFRKKAESLGFCAK